MVSRAYRKWLLECGVQGSEAAPDPDWLDVVATGKEEGSSVVVRIVNRSGEPQGIGLDLVNWRPGSDQATIVSLDAPPDAHNTAEQPYRVIPRQRIVKHHLPHSPANMTVEPHSFTTIRFE